MRRKAYTREQKNYLADPCGTLSIPYYKEKSLTAPPGIRIVHERDFSPEDWAGWQDSPYFRLYHGLSHIPRILPPEGYRLSGMEEAEILSWRRRPWFRPELWLQMLDGGGQMAGAALAEFDFEMGEGALEWVQVHPDHRRRGVGAALVSALLEQLEKIADFATVSGEINNPCMPETLYRRCGFTGNDIWHILRKSSV